MASLGAKFPILCKFEVAQYEIVYNTSKPSTEKCTTESLAWCKSWNFENRNQSNCNWVFSSYTGGAIRLEESTADTAEQWLQLIGPDRTFVAAFIRYAISFCPIILIRSPPCSIFHPDIL